MACAAGDFAAAFAFHRDGLVIKRDIDDRRGMAHSLEGLAAVCAGLREPLRAARLFGAAEQLRVDIGVPIPAGKRQSHDAAVHYATALAESRSAFDECWQHGRLMGLSNAVAYALEPASANTLDRTG